MVLRIIPQAYTYLVPLSLDSNTSPNPPLPELAMVTLGIALAGKVGIFPHCIFRMGPGMYLRMERWRSPVVHVLLLLGQGSLGSGGVGVHPGVYLSEKPTATMLPSLAWMGVYTQLSSSSNPATILGESKSHSAGGAMVCPVASVVKKTVKKRWIVHCKSLLIWQLHRLFWCVWVRVSMFMIRESV